MIYLIEITDDGDAATSQELDIEDTVRANLACCSDMENVTKFRHPI